MPVNAYKCNEYIADYKKEMYDKLFLELNNSKNTHIPTYLICNIKIYNHFIDACIIKSDAVIIIQFVEGGGRLIYKDNSIENFVSEIKNGNDKFIRHEEMKFLKTELQRFLNQKVFDRKIIDTTNTNLANINTLMIFKDDITFNEIDLPKTIIPWFLVSDISNAHHKIVFKNNKDFNLSESEISNIIKEFGVNESQLNKADINKEISPTINLKNMNINENQKMELQEIANDIHSLNSKLEDAKYQLKKYHSKFDEFIELFSEKKGWYLVQGIICLAVLLFDFWVSEKSLYYLSQIIYIKVLYLAILFSLIDGGIAILASGKFAGKDPIKEKRQKRTFRPVLIILAIVKIILFFVLLYTQYRFVDRDTGEIIFQIGTMEMLQVLLPQVFFITIVYFVLGVAGIGLWYVIGSAFFWVWNFMISTPLTYENKLNEKCNDFKAKVQFFNIDLSEAKEKFNLSNFCH